MTRTFPAHGLLLVAAVIGLAGCDGSVPTPTAPSSSVASQKAATAGRGREPRRPRAPDSARSKPAHGKVDVCVLQHDGGYRLKTVPERQVDSLLERGAVLPLHGFADGDGDGFGNPGAPLGGCPDRVVADGTDCDDTDANVFPGAPEIADGKDSNCNCPPGVVPTQARYALCISLADCRIALEVPPVDGEVAICGDGIVDPCGLPVGEDCDDGPVVDPRSGLRGNAELVGGPCVVLPEVAGDFADFCADETGRGCVDPVAGGLRFLGDFCIAGAGEIVSCSAAFSTRRTGPSADRLGFWVDPDTNDLFVQCILGIIGGGLAFEPGA